MSAILFYNVFIPAHVFLLPETLGLAILLHGLVTAWIVAGGIILRTKPTMVIREAIAISIPVLMIAQIMTIFLLNPSGVAVHYQYLAVMIVIYMNANVRPDFRYALCASAAVGLLYGIALILHDGPAAAKIIGCASMASAIYLSLTANWRMERDARHAFLRRLQDQLRREDAEAEADRDPLTGLANRRAFDEATRGLWSVADTSAVAAIVMADVDHFKAFNDCYGHPAGDLCLKRVASALRSVLPDESCMVARFGGEEFVMLLPRTDLPTAIRVAERARRAVENLAIPHEGVAAGRRITLSLGVLAGPVASHPTVELVLGADAALYAAKRAGRNQVWPPLVKLGTEILPLRQAPRSLAS